MSLFCKIPRECKEDLNTKFTNLNTRFQTHEFFKKMKETCFEYEYYKDYRYYRII